MPKFYSSISEDLAEWALKQPVFFVASAPLNGDHVNCSPKGYTSRSLAIIDPNTVAYIDATGSGAETISHCYENGRVTVMFCGFGTCPRIMRFFCRGSVVERDTPEYERWYPKLGKVHEKAMLSARAIIVLDVFKVQTSCGFGVPVQQTPAKEGDSAQVRNSEEQVAKAGDSFEERDTMDTWAEKKVKAGQLAEYQQLNNAFSLDKLPGLKSARRARGQVMLVDQSKAYFTRLLKQWDAMLVGALLVLVGLLVPLVLGSSPVRRCLLETWDE